MLENAFLDKLEEVIEETKSEMDKRGKGLDNMAEEDIGILIFSFAKNLAENLQDVKKNTPQKDQYVVANPYIPPKRIYQIASLCYLYFEKFLSVDDNINVDGVEIWQG